jgi:hypothetical protein
MDRTGKNRTSTLYFSGQLASLCVIVFLAAVSSANAVPNLPSGCRSTVINGVNYLNCAGVYYRPGFQGNNVVYIISAP